MGGESDGAQFRTVIFLLSGDIYKENEGWFFILYLFKQQIELIERMFKFIDLWKNLLKSINNVYENRFSFFCILLERLCCFPKKYIIIIGDSMVDCN